MYSDITTLWHLPSLRNMHSFSWTTHWYATRQKQKGETTRTPSHLYLHSISRSYCHSPAWCRGYLARIMGASTSRTPWFYWRRHLERACTTGLQRRKTCSDTPDSSCWPVPLDTTKPTSTTRRLHMEPDRSTWRLCVSQAYGDSIASYKEVLKRPPL